MPRILNLTFKIIFRSLDSLVLTGIYLSSVPNNMDNRSVKDLVNIVIVILKTSIDLSLPTYARINSQYSKCKMVSRDGSAL